MSAGGWLDPISEDAPCGPDLNALVDPEFDEYYYGALGRLPDFILRPGVERPDGSRTPDQVFDPASVEIASEASAITALLQRSRDLRLLVLLAQFEVLAGRLPRMAEAVEAVAGLLAAYPDAVHPQLQAGPSERREVLGDLNQPVTMVQALQFAGLIGSSMVTLRKLKVASGLLKPQTQEESEIEPGLDEQLALAPNRPKVEQSHDALLRFLGALGRIETACKTHPTHPFAPNFEQVRAVALEMLEAITKACPDLQGAAALQPVTSDALPDATDTPAQAARAAIPLAGGHAITVSDHAHARMILEACEGYYRRCEPSSAALLLVIQARKLIGRPFLEALQILMPAQAQSARIDFGAQLGVQIGITQLQALSGELDTAPSPAPDAKHTVSEISAPQDAAAALESVEGYFRRHERSSPVPFLLQRARSYLNHDFEALVAEVIPRDDPQK